MYNGMLSGRQIYKKLKKKRMSKANIEKETRKELERQCDAAIRRRDVDSLYCRLESVKRYKVIMDNVLSIFFSGLVSILITSIFIGSVFIEGSCFEKIIATLFYLGIGIVIVVVFWLPFKMTYGLYYARIQDYEIQLLSDSIDTILYGKENDAEKREKPKMRNFRRRSKRYTKYATKHATNPRGETASYKRRIP